MREHGDWQGKELLSRFAKANRNALRYLEEITSQDDIRAAVKMLNSASRIFIIGNGRAHAVATNFIYELNHVDKQKFLISGTRSMFREEVSNVVRGDLLIANSSGPYSSNTCEMAATVANKGVIMLSITDSAVSPLANISQLSFVVH